MLRQDASGVINACKSAVSEPVEWRHSVLSEDPSPWLAQDETPDSSILTRLLVDPLLAAPEDWRAVFIQGVLPALNHTAKKSYQLLIANDGWSEDDVAAAMIYVLVEAIGDPLAYVNLQEGLELALQHPALIDYFRQVDIVCDDFMLNFMDPVNLENRPQKKVDPKSQSRFKVKDAWNALLSDRQHFLHGLRKRG